MSLLKPPIHLLFVTSCRSDYGPVALLLRDLFEETRLRISVVVGGAHLSEVHGRTVTEVERDGIPIAHRLDWLADARDSAFGNASARALAMFNDLLRETKPDAVVLYGDRHELLPLATACVLERTPIVHLCGGDVTEGALDDQVRHAVTKLSHVHLATSERSAERIRQMGEEPWRVHAVGDPLIDAFVRGERASADELEAFLGFRPDRSTLLVTLHPTTLEPHLQEPEVEACAAALESYAGSLILTAPAPDPGFESIAERWARLVATHPKAAYVDSLGSRRYRGALFAVGAMVGNSSSGLTEAPCVGLPAINVGRRQSGRDRAENVIDVPSGDQAALAAAIRFALEPVQQDRLRNGSRTSPYGDGRSNQRVIEALLALPSRPRLLDKRFIDYIAATNR